MGCWVFCSPIASPAVRYDHCPAHTYFLTHMLAQRLMALTGGLIDQVVCVDLEERAGFAQFVEIFEELGHNADGGAKHTPAEVAGIAATGTVDNSGSTSIADSDGGQYQRHAQGTGGARRGRRAGSERIRCSAVFDSSNSRNAKARTRSRGRGPIRIVLTEAMVLLAATPSPCSTRRSTKRTTR